ncbi:hypothetical protein D3C81_500980 [compost metagenome]
MDKSTDFKDHPATYAVMVWNDGDEQVNAMYFAGIVEATKAFEDGDKSHDNVHMYQLFRCSETKIK